MRGLRRTMQQPAPATRPSKCTFTGMEPALTMPKPWKNIISIMAKS